MVGCADPAQRAVVMGGRGFVGARLCEMLVEHGCQSVVAFDCRPPVDGITQRAGVQHVTGSITDVTAMTALLAGGDGGGTATVVYHCAAVVGPYHSHELYEEINYRGTLAVIESCRAAGVRRLVVSSTPSSRFDPDNLDVCGKREDELLFPDELSPPRAFVAEYARTKAMGERAVQAACSPDLATCCVAPHQVYGPGDRLMMPNVLAAARWSLFRIWGDGNTLISLTYVDNYCHAMMLAANALLDPNSIVRGNSYIVTDGDPVNLWQTFDKVVIALYGDDYSIFKLRAIPAWLILGLAHVCDAVSAVIGIKFKLNVFAARMMLINRWFDISNAQRDLGYTPIVTPAVGWARTIAWLRDAS